MASRSNKSIRATGVRVHNLKNLDFEIPREQLVAICGVSGSGKTSLALDTLYAEGQRRYIESFSAYTRQFLERIDKPDFDSLEGLPPALAVTRGNAPRGNRSTVGTASETLDYLRLLYANFSSCRCYRCQRPVAAHTPQSVARLIQEGPACRMMLCLETSWQDVGERASVLAEMQSQGFVRLISSGKLLHLAGDRGDLGQALPEAGSGWIVVDRLKGGSKVERTTESLETCFDLGHGSVSLLVEAAAGAQILADRAAVNTTLTIDDHDWSVLGFSAVRRCADCAIEYPDPEARLFSFNSPLGACPQCEGFGDTIDLDWDLLVPDSSLSIADGAIAPWSTPAYAHHLDDLLSRSRKLKLRTRVPFSDLTERERNLVLNGDPAKEYGGISGFFKALDRKKYKMHVRVFLARWKSYNRCSACNGQRLSPEALAYQIDGQNIADLCALEIDALREFFSAINQERIARLKLGNVLEQIQARLGYLAAVGLGYLHLDRPLRTLSGGEVQRTALTCALGSNLVKMLYVLDEPSVGLHPHDVDRLSAEIHKLVVRGNTVIVVEHEEQLLRQASEILEIGPLAGREGGQIVYQGPPKLPGKRAKSKSVTLDFLSGKRCIPIPERRKQPDSFIELRGCRGHNLQDINVSFPLGVLCAVTGVSGSGKSSLIQDTMYGALNAALTGQAVDALPFESIDGYEDLEDCQLVDQSPVSRSARSNPVTFIKAFAEIRKVFADTADARIRGLNAGHFSFNSTSGRCPQCEGNGTLTVDMQFLADVEMKCTSCDGRRFKEDILAVQYRNRSIHDVLQMTCAEAIGFFRGAPKVQQRLEILREVGLDYLALGQSAATLSSGEAQRLKLAGFLANASNVPTLFIMDEPTTGLHPVDILKLLACFQTLLKRGNSLIVVEHNVSLIAAADYVIDLGPGAASDGGKVVCAGTPEKVSQEPASTTGIYLKRVLQTEQ